MTVVILNFSLEVLTKMNYIYDVLVVLVFSLFLVFGYRKGLLHTLIQFAMTLVSIVLAYLFVNPFTDWLADRGFLRQTTDSITSNVGEKIQAFGDELLSPLTSYMPGKWARGIIVQTEQAQGSLASQAGDATARLFLGAVAFLILLLTLRAILTLATIALSRTIDHIPLLGRVNRFGGLLLGAVFALVVIWLVTMILTALAVKYETLHSILSSSLILDFFSDKDIFMSLLDTII